MNDKGSLKTACFIIKYQSKLAINHGLKYFILQEYPSAISWQCWLQWHQMYPHWPCCDKPWTDEAGHRGSWCQTPGQDRTGWASWEQTHPCSSPRRCKASSHKGPRPASPSIPASPSHWPDWSSPALPSRPPRECSPEEKATLFFFSGKTPKKSVLTLIRMTFWALPQNLLLHFLKSCPIQRRKSYHVQIY